MNTAGLIHWGWRLAPRLPGVLVRSIAALAADGAWLVRNGSCAQFETNLAYVWPNASRRQIRRVSRSAMRSTMRYYAETMMLSAATPEQIRARVRPIDEHHASDALESGSIILALAHQANYDLAGAWVSAELAPLVAVVERLEPPELFADFKRFREELGIRIYAHTGDDAFRNLVREVRNGPVVAALVADRDMSGTAVPVQLFGHTVHVAAGPAALAMLTGAPIVPTTIRYERLSGWRRTAAGSPWGIVLRFYEPVYVDRSRPKAERLQIPSQQWVDAIADSIRTDPADWHMMAPYFDQEPA